MLGFRVVTSIFVLFTAFLLGAPYSAAAQEELFDSVDPEAAVMPAEISPSHREAIAKVLGIPANGRHMEKILENYRLGLAMEEGAVHSPSEKDETAPIFRHLRGKEGAPVPTRDQLPKIAEFGPKQEVEAVAAQLGYNDELHAGLHASIKIPPCRESGTEKLQLSELPATPDLQNSALDILFVDEKLAQRDLDEIYGENIEIVSVGEGPGNFGAMSAQSVGAACLPYRMRVTSRFTYRHRGEDAVKDYREDVDGVGTLSERAKALLGKRGGV